MTNGTSPARDTLDDKANQLFAGKVVRKDLVRKVKVGANVPVFVLEFLRSQIITFGLTSPQKPRAK
jgi:ATP-dependent Lon protease